MIHIAYTDAWVLVICMHLCGTIITASFLVMSAVAYNDRKACRYGEDWLPALAISFILWPFLAVALWAWALSASRPDQRDI